MDGDPAVPLSGLEARLVPVAAAEARAVLVADGNHETYPQIFHTGIRIVEIGVVRLVGEAARRAETHIDDVHAQRGAVVDRSQNVHGVRAAQHAAVEIVGEHFHDSQLRVGRHADERFARGRIDDFGIVLAGHDAGHVRAVGGIRREHVGIRIGVVVRVRHFEVIENVVDGKVRRKFGLGDGFVQFGGDVLFLPPSLAIGRHGGKRRVRVIESGIQNGHDHAVSLIFDVRRIVYAGGIHVGVIADGHRLRHVIRLRPVHAGHAGDLRQLVEIGRIHPVPPARC